MGSKWPIRRTQFLKKKLSNGLANGLPSSMSPGTIEDLEAIAQYISADSSAYAATVLKS
jgi:hypothetical protein